MTDDPHEDSHAELRTAPQTASSDRGEQMSGKAAEAFSAASQSLADAANNAMNCDTWRAAREALRDMEDALDEARHALIDHDDEEAAPVEDSPCVARAVADLSDAREPKNVLGLRTTWP